MTSSFKWSINSDVRLVATMWLLRFGVPGRNFQRVTGRLTPACRMDVWVIWVHPLIIDMTPAIIMDLNKKRRASCNRYKYHTCTQAQNAHRSMTHVTASGHVSSYSCRPIQAHRHTLNSCCHFNFWVHYIHTHNPLIQVVLFRLGGSFIFLCLLCFCKLLHQMRLPSSVWFSQIVGSCIAHINQSINFPLGWAWWIFFMCYVISQR